MKLLQFKLYCFVICVFGVKGCIDHKKGDAIESSPLVVDQEPVQIQYQNQDTFKLGYAYWWPQSGPFLGYCGEPYSLVFLGTVVELQEEHLEEHYVAQKGIIRVDSVLFSKKLQENRYQNEKLISTDAFYQANIKENERILVCCYAYEDNYVNPGGKSILKIEGIQDPKVQSLITYIQSGQDAGSIEGDIDIWEQQHLGFDLKQIISCKEEMLSN